MAHRPSGVEACEGQWLRTTAAHRALAGRSLNSLAEPLAAAPCYFRARMHLYVVALALVALLGLAACENEPPKTALGYTEDAKRAYDEAFVAYKAHSWIEAQTLFR